MTPPVIENDVQTYQIGLIADLDKDSKDTSQKNTWHSFLTMGELNFNPENNSVQIKFNDEKLPKEESSGYSLKGRGMELSELVTFDGRMLTFDDRTGIVFHLEGNNVLPWAILADGAGEASKGFKCEWATVKDDVLYVGSMGREWTSDTGDIENYDYMYVKTVSKSGEVNLE